jgi:hypothetical protein
VWYNPCRRDALPVLAVASGFAASREAFFVVIPDSGIFVKPCGV